MLTSNQPSSTLECRLVIYSNILYLLLLYILLPLSSGKYHSLYKKLTLFSLDPLK